MSEQITITLPEPLYRRARALARERRRSLDFIIIDALGHALSAESGFVDEPTDSPFSSEGEAGKRLKAETAAYMAMHSRLMRDYAGQYVAVFNGQLVDHDADETALLRRIETSFPDDVVLLKRVAPIPEPEIRIRSPRLERR